MSALMPLTILEAPAVDWTILTPVSIIFGAAVIGVLVEAFVPMKARRPVQLLLSAAAIIAAFITLVARWVSVAETPGILPEYTEDLLTLSAQLILLVVGFFAILVIVDRSEIGDGAFAAQPSDRPGSSDEDLSIAHHHQRTEIFPLTLFSLGGMMVFPAANTFVSLFIALEVMSLPLYILAATARRRRQLSFESAMKYFILGAFSSAFFLMGAAMLYGYSNSLTLSQVTRSAISGANGMDWLLVTGTVLLLVGLLFKVGAAPFHAWTPDVYQGAPTPITGFMAAGVKVAAFAAMVRIYLTLGNLLSWDLQVMIIAIAVLTMLVGTVTGLVQSDIKRLLAYSSIAHAGFILIAIVAGTPETASAVLFYTLSYGVSTIGAFAVVALVRNADKDANVTGEATDLARWAGMGRKSPAAAVAMLIFLLSFAGIPLTAGFVGKFVVFAAGIRAGLWPLVAVAIICSAITAFYYFSLVRTMFFTRPDEHTVVVKSEGYSFIAILVSAVLTVMLGIFPTPILDLLSHVTVVLP